MSELSSRCSSVAVAFTSTIDLLSSVGRSFGVVSAGALPAAATIMAAAIIRFVIVRLIFSSPLQESLSDFVAIRRNGMQLAAHNVATPKLLIRGDSTPRGGGCD